MCVCVCVGGGGLWGKRGRGRRSRLPSLAAVTRALSPLPLANCQKTAALHDKNQSLTIY